MSSCACRRWGTGTVCEKPINTDNARELEAKMKAAMAEREAHANFWKTPVVAAPTPEPQTNYQCAAKVSTTENNKTVVSPTETSQQQLRFWN